MSTSPASLTRPRPPSTSPTTTYLLLYNLTSSILWLTILGRLTLLLALTHDPTHTYAALGTFTRNVQSLALLEVLHAAVGAVRAPLSTTAMQVASRVVLVWVVVEGFGHHNHNNNKSPSPSSPEQPERGLEQSYAYSSMLFAWSVTEVVRYTFFVCQLHQDVPVPSSLRWARYNLFWVMYPLGIGSECWLVWRASQVAGKMSSVEGGQRVAGVDAGWWQWGFWVVLGVYVPGSWVMMSHMVKQRRRVARGKGKER